METQITHKVSINRSKKTLTIKCYDKGERCATYREDCISPEIMETAEDWTEADIVNYLIKSESYYFVK
jgi:hypothetical protein